MQVLDRATLQDIKPPSCITVELTVGIIDLESESEFGFHEIPLRGASKVGLTNGVAVFDSLRFTKTSYLTGVRDRLTL